MSDDLIKRLRAKKQKGNRFDSLEYEAADRIEALTAKLNKAVEALEEISEYDTGANASLAYTAKQRLAEIKGESHDRA